MFEGAGGIVEDRSINKNNGVVSGAGWQLALTFGVCLRFGGVVDYIECGNDDSINLVDKFTISAWVKVVAGVVDGYILSKNLLAYSDSQYGLYWAEGLKRLVVLINGGLVGASANDSVLVGEERHCAVVYDRVDVRYYIDGVLSGSITPYTAAILPRAYSVNIGRRHPAHYHFKGDMSRVLLYSRALSAQEILDIYERTKN
jgi:hypothetical protein